MPGPGWPAKDACRCPLGQEPNVEGPHWRCCVRRGYDTSKCGCQGGHWKWGGTQMEAMEWVQERTLSVHISGTRQRPRSLQPRWRKIEEEWPELREENQGLGP